MSANSSTTPLSVAASRAAEAGAHPSAAYAAAPAIRETMSSRGEQALILGGGGSTGNAWLIGVIAGLFDGGLDVTRADLTVGTSAGSTAAAQIAGESPADLLETILAAVPVQGSGSLASRRRTNVGMPVSDQLERMTKIIASAPDISEMRRRMGAAALDRDAESDGTWPARWRATVATRFTQKRWPERKVLITAVDAQTGEPVVFDRTSGVDLVDAVAASCSSGLPYRIGEHQYIDGGYRSNAENADLATGYRRILVLSPFGGRSLMPKEWGVHLATQIEELREQGSEVETIFPDADAEHMFGANAMDLSLRPAAAQAGHQQGVALASGLSIFWR